MSNPVFLSRCKKRVFRVFRVLTGLKRRHIDVSARPNRKTHLCLRHYCKAGVCKTCLGYNPHGYNVSEPSRHKRHKRHRKNLQPENWPIAAAQS